jgi:hypothetical protein
LDGSLAIDRGNGALSLDRRALSVCRAFGVLVHVAWGEDLPGRRVHLAGCTTGASVPGFE